MKDMGKKRLYLLASAGVLLISANGAYAQSTPSDAPAEDQAEKAAYGDEIVVTARKREETSLAVPVSITAIGGEQIETRGYTGMDTIARLVPGLVLSSAGTGFQGTAVLRGVGGTETNDLGDAAVSYNVDGVQVAKGSIRRLATFDLQQVEVLKGPQPLFFGKNSPGGIISIRSADPTPVFEGKIGSYYEFNAREIWADGYVSGPISDTLGIRLAAYGTNRRGWINVVVPPGVPLFHDWAPRNTEGGGRLTLKYDGGGGFDVRLKVAYSKMSGGSIADAVQLVHCPYGTPQFAVPATATPGVPQVVAPGPGVDDCTANSTGSTSDPVAFVGIHPGIGDGRTHAKEEQFLTGLEMNYELADDLTLTSQTGYYTFAFGGVSNTSATYVAQKMQTSVKNTAYYEFSQEFRLNSSFNGPFNFSAGGLYQHTVGRSNNSVYTDANAPRFVTANRFRLIGEAASVFAQLRLNPVSTVEIAGGGRYTREIKKLPFAGSGINQAPVVVDVNRVAYNDFSPEATVTWRPTQTVTLFGAYRRGFLSGGFNTGSAPTAGISYRPEFVEGFDTGVKALLFNRSLRTNLTFFSYEIRDLQVTVSTGIAAQTQLRNAARSRSKGVEFDFTYQTPIDGVRLNGAVQYNDAKYKEYLATCYRGLTAPTCRIFLSPVTGGQILAQDLAGEPMFRTPKWSGNLGFTADQELGDGFNLSFSGGMTFSSSFFADAANKPAGKQKPYQLFDASVRVQKDNWEVGLIGTNLTETYYWTRAADTSNTGGVPGTAISVLGDTIAAVSRGREIKVLVGYRF